MPGQNHIAMLARGLSFQYSARPVLQSVDMDIKAGRLTALLGRNGSGKSTLLRILAGLLEYHVGGAELFGRDLQAYSWGERARILGFLPQYHRPVFPFSVADVVLTGRAGHVALTPRQRDVTCAEKAMHQAGVWDLRDRPYTELSGGEQQMVLIARVLAQQPRIILLDEPTAHLDLHNQIAVLNLTRTLVASGVTVLCILHDPNLAFAYADDFIFLREGHILQPQTGQAVWSAAFLEMVYGAGLHVIPFGHRAAILPPPFAMKS